MKQTKTVVVATHNQHKLAEIRAILNIENWEFVSLDTLGIVEEPVENADDFLGNARIKAQAAHQLSGRASLADDSGLVVDALGGAPGVYSARYAGEFCDDQANNGKLLKKLSNIPAHRRQAHFICALVFVDEDGTEITATGKFAGRIGFEPRGQGGFGYDPIFEVEGDVLNRSLAQLDTAEKNAVSHRAQALRQLRDRLLDKIEATDSPARHSPANPSPATVSSSTAGPSQEASSLPPARHSPAADLAPTAHHNPSPLTSHSPARHSPANPSPATVSSQDTGLTAAVQTSAGHNRPVEIVAFDFDGTLINVSSPVRLIARLNRYHIMPKKAIAKSLLWGMRYKMGTELNQAQPRRYIFSSFKNFSASDANAIMRNLYLEELRPLLLEPALNCVREHRRAGRTLIVVSASFEPIIAELSRDIGAAAYICTRMEVKDGAYTGETIGEPPEGEQKMIQFERWANTTYGPEGWILTHAYGDHFSDIPLLSAATEPIAVDPDRRLEAWAQEQSWQIVNWENEHG